MKKNCNISQLGKYSWSINKNLVGKKGQTEKICLILQIFSTISVKMIFAYNSHFLFSRRVYPAPEINEKTCCCTLCHQSQVFVLGLLHCRGSWSCMQIDLIPSSPGWEMAVTVLLICFFINKFSLFSVTVLQFGHCHAECGASFWNHCNFTSCEIHWT